MDWRYGAEHMRTRHRVTVEQATEVLADNERIVADPDPASRSGNSARVIGYSTSAATVLVVILVHREDSAGRVVGRHRMARQQHRTTHLLGADRGEEDSR